MMLEDRFDERTEPATPRRRREARERGFAARSADLTVASIFLAALAVLALLGGSLVEGLAASLRGSLASLDAPRAPEVPWVPLLGLMAAVWIAAVAGEIAQTGFRFRWPVARPGPAEAAAAAPVVASLARFAFAGLKALSLGAVLVLTLWSERHRLFSLSAQAPGEAARFVASLTLVLSARLALALLVLGVIDWAARRAWLEGALRMTRRELLEERRQEEGDPLARRRRRERHRRIAGPDRP